MKLLSRLFNREREITELEYLIAKLSRDHAKLEHTVDTLKEDIRELKEINERLVNCIVRGSSYEAMKTNVRLSKFALTPSHRLLTNVDRPTKKEEE